MVAIRRLRGDVDGSVPQGPTGRLGEEPPLVLLRPSWNPLAGHGGAVGRRIAAGGRRRGGTLAIRGRAAVLLRWLLVRRLSVALGWLSVGSVLLRWGLTVGLLPVGALGRGRVLALRVACSIFGQPRVRRSPGGPRITELLMAGSGKLKLTLAGILLAWIHSTILVLGGQALEIGGQFLEERHGGCGWVGWRGGMAGSFGGDVGGLCARGRERELKRA